MDNIKKIGFIEAIAFIVIVMINRIILNIPKEIIENVGTSAWINVIIISIITLIFILIICKLYKNFNGKDILDISKYLGGNVFKIITSALFFIIFLFATAIVLRNFCDSLQTTFLENTPLAYIILFFLLPMLISNKLGFSAIIKFNLIIIILILLSIIIIFISPISHFNISNLFPLLGNGVDATMLSGLSNLYAFSGITYLFFLMPFLKDTNSFKKISIISFIISSIYLFLSVLILIGLFSSLITSEDMLSILLVTRIINIGSFFQRIDALFILTWILTFMSYLSILLYFILYTFKNITNISNQNGMIYTFLITILGVALLPKNIVEVNFLENEILKYCVLLFSFLFPLTLLILANLKFKRKNKLTKMEETV